MKNDFQQTQSSGRLSSLNKRKVGAPFKNELKCEKKKFSQKSRNRNAIYNLKNNHNFGDPY